MTDWLKNIFRFDLVLPIIIASVVSYFTSFAVVKLSSSQIQAISSTVSTVAGILFGFVMASVTLLASAKGNVLVENTKKTKYLQKLMSRLHRMMAWLLFVCVVFLACLFIPVSFPAPCTIFPENTKCVAVLLSIGVFLFVVSIVKFIFVWREFSEFASNM